MIKKLLHQLHLWLGIGSGLILFIVCLSGSVLTFQTDIEQLLSPDSYRVAAQGQRMPVDSLLAGIQAKYPEQKVLGLTLPQDPEQAATARILDKGEEKGRGKAYLFDPYTGVETAPKAAWVSDTFMWFFRLHRWLLLDTPVGRPIVGVATLIMAFLLLSGLVLWWPKKWKQLKQGLLVKRNASGKRLNYDLHNVLGFYALPLLVVMSLTGLTWSFEWYTDGVYLLLDGKAPQQEMAEGGKKGGKDGKGKREERGQAEQQKPAVSYGTMLSQAEQLLPYPGDYRISLAGDKPVVSISKIDRSGTFSLPSSDKLTFDARSGRLKKQDLYADRSLGEQVMGIVKPLHTGEIFGTFSKVLYLLACLIGTSLPITGTLVWWNKRKPSKKAAV